MPLWLATAPVAMAYAVAAGKAGLTAFELQVMKLVRVLRSNTDEDGAVVVIRFIVQHGAFDGCAGRIARPFGIFTGKQIEYKAVGSKKSISVEMG
jgi:hypothetical protein